MLSDEFGLQIKRFVKQSWASNLANSTKGVSDGWSDTSGLEARIRQLGSQEGEPGLLEYRQPEQGS